MYKGKCSVIIPARNEENTIRNCCEQFASNPQVSQVIVVANDCSDMTYQEALAGNAIAIETSIRGKGSAIKDGLKLANEDVVILLDGDIKNPSSVFVSSLIAGMKNSKTSLVKGAFDRSKQPGPVTDMLVRPVLNVAKHPARVISQPLSGMIAVKRNLLIDIEQMLPNDFGVDLTILLAAYDSGALVREVNLPKLEHRDRPWGHYKEMALEVAKVLSKFDLIKTERINHG